MVFNFNDEEVIITYDGLQIVIQEDKAKELANAILDYFEEEQTMKIRLLNIRYDFETDAFEIEVRSI
jgi:Fe-S cluster assembly iron-binding protein IscA